MKFELIHALKLSSFSDTKLGWSWKQKLQIKLLKKCQKGCLDVGTNYRMA